MQLGRTIIAVIAIAMIILGTAAGLARAVNTEHLPDSDQVVSTPGTGHTGVDVNVHQQEDNS